MSEELDLLEKKIDAALDSYTPRAARPGLEQRIVASVAATPIAAGSGWWSSSLGWALGLVLLVAGLLPVALQQARPRPEAAHVPSVSDAIVRTAPAASVVANAARLAPAAQRPHHYATAESAVGDAGRTTASVASPPFQPLANDAIEIKPITIAPIQIAALN
jgi:uncharacterized protein YjeT (DUF2065 family)